MSGASAAGLQPSLVFESDTESGSDGDYAMFNELAPYPGDQRSILPAALPGGTPRAAVPNGVAPGAAAAVAQHNGWRATSLRERYGDEGSIWGTPPAATEVAPLSPPTVWEADLPSHAVRQPSTHVEPRQYYHSMFLAAQQHQPRQQRSRQQQQQQQPWRHQPHAQRFRRQLERPVGPPSPLVDHRMPMPMPMHGGTANPSQPRATVSSPLFPSPQRSPIPTQPSFRDAGGSVPFAALPPSPVYEAMVVGTPHLGDNYGSAIPAGTFVASPVWHPSELPSTGAVTRTTGWPTRRDRDVWQPHSSPGAPYSSVDDATAAAGATATPVAGPSSQPVDGYHAAQYVGSPPGPPPAPAIQEHQVSTPPARLDVSRRERSAQLRKAIHDENASPMSSAYVHALGRQTVQQLKEQVRVNLAPAVTALSTAHGVVCICIVPTGPSRNR